jgi:ACT domain-containing protein
MIIVPYFKTGLMNNEHHINTGIKHKMKKTIITVVGKDTVGIIAKVCTYLAKNQINVEDISQTIVQGYFNMMMIVDTERSSKIFSEMVIDLDNLGNEIGVRIRCQREDIFTKMHRI